MSTAQLLSRCRGVALGHMVGDALGASVEGFPQQEIRALANETWGVDLIQHYVLAVPMGTFTRGDEPGRYRAANKVNDANFVPQGPPRNEAVKAQCARFGCYTDDTNACLALASSIAECGRVDAQHAAESYVKFFQENERYRGCPPSAKKVLKDVADGVPISQTGLPPHFPFPGGSFANGGAMRISMLPIAYRNAGPEALRNPVTDAILSSHRHGEAVDFAVVQAACVQYALNATVFDPDELLRRLGPMCTTDCMQQMIGRVQSALSQSRGLSDLEVLEAILKTERRPGSGMEFQIASIHMMPCVLWAICKYYEQPKLAVQIAIDLGGDTDTTAAMVGAVVGALHGDEWCREWAADLENGREGRDYAFSLAQRLAELDLTG